MDQVCIPVPMPAEGETLELEVTVGGETRLMQYRIETPPVGPRRLPRRAGRATAHVHSGLCPRLVARAGRVAGRGHRAHHVSATSLGRGRSVVDGTGTDGLVRHRGPARKLLCAGAQRLCGCAHFGWARHRRIGVCGRCGRGRRCGTGVDLYEGSTITPCVLSRRHHETSSPIAPPRRLAFRGPRGRVHRRPGPAERTWSRGGPDRLGRAHDDGRPCCPRGGAWRRRLARCRSRSAVHPAVGPWPGETRASVAPAHRDE